MGAETDIVALRELVAASRRNLQLVEHSIDALQGGRVAVEPASDVASEHKTAWFGVVDDYDGQDGVFLGVIGDATQFGFVPLTQHKGLIRIQEDAAFVVTDVMVALALGERGFPVTAEDTLYNFEEGVDNLNVAPFLRLTDSNTGRNLITGETLGPADKDRGAVPFSYFSSMRPGLGSNVKNRLFAEFTLPRASAVRVEVFNLAPFSGGSAQFYRAYVTLFGYKVFGA